MAGDKEKFESALNRWHGLRNEGRMSYPIEIGAVAIMCCSGAGKLDPEDTTEAEDMISFKTEAFALADLLRSRNHQVETIIDAQANDFDAVLRNPSFSSVVAIGHGSLSSIHIYSGQEERYSWQDVTKAADHLKTGSFVQRHCGGVKQNPPVPLGLFAVSQPNNVFAPVGQIFNPRSLEDTENQKLRRVFAKNSALTYRMIRNLRKY